MTMIKCCQRSSDLVCRYGGDEFAVVLAETDMPGAYVVAERIREAIAAQNYSDLDLKEINNNSSDHPKTSPKNMPRRVTACLGVATMNPVEGGDANELISRADQALYRAKSSGKNRSQV